MKKLNLMWVILILAGASARSANWVTDLDAAKEQAARENKAVLINFTGSDWCGWCIRLKSEIFSQPEFEAYADRNLVLVEIDFPKRKKLSMAQQKANVTIANKMKVGGYPTLVFLNSKGAEIGRGGYRAGGPKPFVEATAKLTGLAAAEGAGTTTSPYSGKAAPSAKPSDIPIFSGAPTVPPPRYDDLILKSISGTKDRRFAMLNNQTFASGDSAKVKLHDGTVNVRCVEIRDSSVVVAIEGQPGQREIRLKTIH